MPMLSDLLLGAGVSFTLKKHIRTKTSVTFQLPISSNITSIFLYLHFFSLQQSPVGGDFELQVLLDPQ